MRMLLETRYGAMECFEADTVVSRALELYGEWAQPELEVLEQLVGPGATVLDIGAFLGTHTLAFARMVGPHGKVHSFEPRQAVRDVLQANVARNDLEQVEIHACALGLRESKLAVPSVEVDVGADKALNFGGLALTGVSVDQAMSAEAILIRPLDAFSFERLDLVKIDAEGMEADVILGGGRTFARHRPIVFAECNDLEKGGEALRALRAMGYSVYGVLSPAYNPHNFRGNTENIFGEASEASLLAVSPEQLSSNAVKRLTSGLPLIDSVDALALLMLHKSQYPTEVLANSSASAVLDLNFVSPLSRTLQEKVETQTRAAQAAQAALAELAERCLQADARAEAQCHRAAAAESYRRTSLQYWWQRLRRQNVTSSRP